MDWIFILRLFVAGLLGGIVGFEREFRAKEAGVRTHFIVALGSALFMIISQFAFGDSPAAFDSSRVAAQVVSGIGFIGAGVIIFQKNAVRGVTTAAGLWVVAAIGLACGAGMFLVAGAAAVMTVICLEAMHFIHLRHGERIVSVSVADLDRSNLTALFSALAEAGMSVESYSLSEGRTTFVLHLREKDYIAQIQALDAIFADARIDSII